ncbi:MAG: DegV family protein [Eubacterium sp.]|nr:DegV family protein [Eubacterium sp.]
MTIQKNDRQSRKAAIMTDSNSALAPEEAAWLGVTVLQTPYMIDGIEQIDSAAGNSGFENSSAEHPALKNLAEKMMAGAEVSTSQIAPGVYMDTWDRLLEDHDEVLFIPLSSALSGEMQTARMLAEDDDYRGKVFVTDNLRVSVTQKEAVYEACALRDAGKSASEILEILEKSAGDASIYVTTPTLKYLKKGGRISPAAAALGTILNIKPVLSINGDKPDLAAKVRSSRKAEDAMIQAIRNDIDGKYQGRQLRFAIASTMSEEQTKKWKSKVMAAFHLAELTADILPPVLTCHIGPGAFGIAVIAVSKEAEGLTPSCLAS